ncbi:unnamed protein product [Closterium sp. NIES-54]
MSLMPSHLMSLMPSHPMSLIPSHPMSLIPSHPMSLIPSHPMPHSYLHSNRLSGPLPADLWRFPSLTDV